MPEEGEPPAKVEWVFEVEDREEVLAPPPTGQSNSWLSWLHGQHHTDHPTHESVGPVGHHHHSRESDQSAASLPGESRDAEGPAGASEQTGGVFGLMGFGAWFAEPDNPLPPPAKSRMDESDSMAGEQRVRWSVELDIPDHMLDDEVVPERVVKTASTATSLPPASTMITRTEAMKEENMHIYYSDDFLEQFNTADIASAVAAAVPGDPDPPLPPPSDYPPEEGFHEVDLRAAPLPVGMHQVEVQELKAQPDSIDEEVDDVALFVESEEPAERKTCCSKCKAAMRYACTCQCFSSKGKDSEDPAMKETASKLLDEEIEDFSGRPIIACIAWLSHRGMAKCPFCCVIIGFTVTLMIISIGMVTRPMEVEIDWDSFLKTDVNTSTMRDVFLFALQQRQTDRRLTEVRELSEARELQGNRLYYHNDLYLAYQIPADEDAGEHGLMSARWLSSVRKFEQRLRSGYEWQVLCNRSDDIDRPLCDYGVSLVNYLYPSPMIAGPDIVPNSLLYDAGGIQALAPQVVTVLMEEHRVKDIIVPRNYEDGTPLKMIRSAFRFKRFCCTSVQSSSEQRAVLSEMRANWDRFLDGTVIPALREEQFREKKPKMEMFYTGSTLYSKEVTSTLMGDLFLAGGSMAFVLVYLILHTNSILLGCLGLMLIASAIPTSYVLFALVTGSNKMSIASFLSVFLIVGLGSDVVFVYTDFWADSRLRKVNYGSRMTWTLVHAGKASLATSVTTALSFFANLASVLKPLREFGFFMGLCVIVVWVVLSLVYVPLCMVDEYWCRRCRLPCDKMGKAFTTSGVRISRSEVSGALRGGLEMYPRISRITRVILRYKRSICLCPVVISIGFIIWAVLVLQVDSGVPSIFPEDHNLNKGTEVFALFKDTSEVFNPLWLIDRPQISVCNDEIFTPISPTYQLGSWGYNCQLNWCEADPDVTQSEEGTCKCWRREAASTCSSDFATVNTKIVAGRQLTVEDVRGPVADYFGLTAGHQISNQQRQGLQRTTNVAPVVTEEWERGSREVREVTEVLGTVERTEQTSSCGYQDLCFCTSWACKMPAGNEWRKVPNLQIPALINATQRRLSASRSKALSAEPPAVPVPEPLSEPKEAKLEGPVAPRYLEMLSPEDQVVAPANRATVDVVFGITVTATSLLLGEVDLQNGWEFTELHEVSQPWAQRNMYQFCTDFPLELRVVESRCWIRDFRTYLLARGNRFPIVASQFEQLIIPFAESYLTGMRSTKDFLWIRDGKVKASYIPMTVDFARYAATEDAIEYKTLWDKYLDDFNLEASIYSKGAWHTSVVWVRAEAQSALIRSTIVTIAIVVGLALLGMLIFTKDSKLSSLVVGSTLIVVFALTWFIVVVMGWPIGPIEVIALIVFIGYAVTYSLHIAHRYGSSDVQQELSLSGDSSDIRFLRTVFALGSIGRAALGSAVTTAGCSIFLVFCTLTIFKKLGGVVLVVTVMSIAVALIPLPAALLWFGPVRPGRCFCFYPTETYENLMNSREKYVQDLEKRKEQQAKQREEKAEMKKQESDRKQREKEEEEERKRKEKEEEERKKKEAKEKAKQLSAKAKAAKAKAGPQKIRTGSGESSVAEAEGLRTRTGSSEAALPSPGLKASAPPARRISGNEHTSGRISATGLEVGEEMPSGAIQVSGR